MRNFCFTVTGDITMEKKYRQKVSDWDGRGLYRILQQKTVTKKFRSNNTRGKAGDVQFAGSIKLPAGRPAGIKNLYFLDCLLDRERFTQFSDSPKMKICY